MTKQQLDEIRAVIIECRRLGWVSRVVDDCDDLLKEVERLQLREQQLLEQKLAMMRVIAKNVSLHPPEDTQLETSNGTN